MPPLAQSKAKIPHAFVFEALTPLEPELRRMFSGFAIYVADRLVCMLREHRESPCDNGVWLVLSEGTDPADASLQGDFPSIRPIEMLNNKMRHWLLIPSDNPDFETEALRACQLLLARDPRFGRVPKSRR